MSVGHYITVGADDEARTQRTVLRLLLDAAGRLWEKSSKNLEGGIARVHRKTVNNRFTTSVLHGTDVDDRWRLLFSKFDEIGQAPRLRHSDGRRGHSHDQKGNEYIEQTRQAI